MPSLYGILADVRRDRPSQATSKTLDILISELGRSRDNRGRDFRCRTFQNDSVFRQLIQLDALLQNKLGIA